MPAAGILTNSGSLRGWQGRARRACSCRERGGVRGCTRRDAVAPEYTGWPTHAGCEGYVEDQTHYIEVDMIKSQYPGPELARTRSNLKARGPRSIYLSLNRLPQTQHLSER